jgi:hypothetical protein
MSHQDWETVATFPWLPEALIVRSMLQNEGIEAFIPEEHSVSVNPVMTGMVVRVQVREKDAAVARTLIQEVEESVPEDKKVCPNCGSDRFRLEPKTTKNFWTFIFGLFVGLPFRRHSSKKSCANCGTPY